MRRQNSSFIRSETVQYPAIVTKDTRNETITIKQG
jgi:hypothetical protein